MRAGGPIAWLLAALVGSVALSQEPATSRLEARAFGAPLTIEIVDLGSAAATRDALADALAEVKEVEELTRDDSDAEPAGLGARGVPALNRRTGEAVVIDSRLFQLLERAREYCVWSQQAHGPLGGHLYPLWQQGGLAPPPSVLIDLAQTAECGRLQLDSGSLTATLAEGSRLDLSGFRRGFAVDLATDVLARSGAGNGWVSVGRILRAIGGGLRGAGWPMAVSPMSGDDAPTERVVLRDSALALASPLEQTFEVGGRAWAPYLNQRNGRPVSGVVGVVVSTPRALDAEALAVALFVMPSREGEYRSGLLQPKPAVKWFLGSGQGPPLEAEAGWSSLRTW